MGEIADDLMMHAERLYDEGGNKTVPTIIAEAIFAERESKAMVRPLPWSEIEDGWIGASGHGFPYSYEARVTDRGGVRMRMGTSAWDYFHGTLDEAKAHAQTDYERRVLMALDHSQAPSSPNNPTPESEKR